MSKTYRVLIVEDEEIESKALAMMLKYNRGDIGEILTAANGVQALELYKAHMPDIVLMDINLPGIDGLEVIRQIQRLPGKPGVVIVSAHSQFAYAREALRLGVQDFLVKPIDLEDIDRVLNEVIRQLEQDRSRREDLRHRSAKTDEIRAILERDCILSIASMQSDTPLASLFDFMQIPITGGFVFVVSGEGVGSALLKEIKSRVCGMGISRCIGEIINSFCICVALSDRKISREEIRDMMTLLSGWIKADARGYHIGVGSPADCADDLRRSYEQAMSACCNLGGAELAGVNGSRVPETLFGVTREAAKIVQCIRAGNTAGLAAEVRGFFGAFGMAVTHRQLQEAVYWLYIMVVGNFPEHSSVLKPLTSVRIFTTQDASALCATLTEAFTALINSEDDDDNPGSNQIVSKAIQIVKQRFREDLTLDVVSEELNISLFYLSKLFRKNTGVSFSEYLTRIRLEHAKALLEKGELSVKEVAYDAGFNSQSYFSKIFKKYVGKSPSEYHGE